MFDRHNNKSILSWSFFNPDEFFSGSLDTKIYMWDIKTKKNVNDFNTGSKKVKHIMCDPMNPN